MKIFFCSLLFVASLAAEGHSSIVNDGFVLWKPSPEHKTFFLPKLRGETDGQAIANYLESVEKSSLANLVPASNLRQLNGVVYSGRKILSENYVQKLLIIANQVGDHDSNSARLESYLKLYAGLELNEYLYPVGAALRLSKSQREIFYRRMTQFFGHVLLLGGDDLAPELYNEILSHSVNVKPLRDLLELEVYKSFRKHAPRARGTGICRGGQLGAVGEGHALVQDMRHVGHFVDSHVGNVRQILRLDSTADLGFIRDLVDVNEEIEITCHHHQVSQEFGINSSLVLLGYALDKSGKKVPELYRTRDGQFMFFQMHPERSPESSAIRAIARAHMKSVLTCTGALSPPNQVLVAEPRSAVL